MKAQEIREYLLSICRQRKRLNRYGFCKRKPQLTDEFVFVLETWLNSYPEASLKGMATFFLRHEDKIYFIIPTPRQNTAQHNKFFEIQKFCKAFITQNAAV